MNTAAPQRSRTRRAEPREDIRQDTHVLETHGRVRKRKGTTDKFWIDPKVIPAGWSYEWKRKTVMGYQDVGYDTELLEQGWTPVDIRRHPNMMPDGWKGNIERDGLVLMERPMALTLEAKAEDDEAARDQIRRREQMNGETQQGQEGMPRTKPVINSGFDTALAVPKD